MCFDEFLNEILSMNLKSDLKNRILLRLSANDDLLHILNRLSDILEIQTGKTLKFPVRTFFTIEQDSSELFLGLKDCALLHLVFN